MNKDTLKSMLEIIRACESVHLCSFDGEYPDVRHVANAMNRDADNLTLYFMTSHNTPKAAQLTQNPHCCLYYFNPENRHALRLFGEIKFVTDMNMRRKFWRDEYKKFGYRGPDDNDFVLMQFIPAAYKYYVGPEIHTGRITTAD